MTIDPERRQLLLQYMGGERQAMEEGWGDEFGPLLDYLTLACFPDQGRDRLRAALEARPVARTMVLTGERCTGAAEDGSDSPIMLGMVEAVSMLAPHATKVPGLARNGREPDALSVIFSGGQMLTRVTGELPGSELAAQFNALTDDEFASYVQYEQCSLNTGDQGTALGGLVWARNVQRLVIVHVVDHIARFAATVLEGWRANRDGRLAPARDWLAKDKIARADFDKLNRPWPELHLLPVGSLDDVDPRRGKNGGISRAREAFGPVQTNEECIVSGKRLGGEYAANRYGTECLPERIGGDKGSVTYACRALPPSQMLELLGAG